MIKIVFIIIATLLSVLHINAQQIAGTLKKHIEQTTKLTGFDYYKSDTLVNSRVDSLWFFTLNYPATYSGMDILKIQDDSRLNVVLNKEDIALKVTPPERNRQSSLLQQYRNNRFIKIAKNILLNSNSYGAWRYLQQLYKLPHFKNKYQTLKNIEK